MTLVVQKPADLGESGWNALLPQRKPFGELQQDINADFLIVGAGYAGLAAARRLRQLNPDARIVLLDAREIGEGPAGRSSGFMIDLPHTLSSASYTGASDQDLREIRMNRAAIKFSAAASQEWGFETEAFNPCGKVNAAAGALGLRRNQSYAQHLEKLSESCELLDAAQMQALCGSDYYRGGLFTPGTVMIQPALFLRRYADALTQQENCELFENTPVLELCRQSSSWLARTSKGSVNADRVILAVNGLIETFGYYRKRLMHINLYASMTRALSADEIKRLGGESAWGCTPSDAMGSTVRKISGSGGVRLIIRNRCTYEASLQLPDNRLDKIDRDHRRSFDARFPMLRNVAMEQRWSGRLCLSRNNVSAIARLDEGLFSACCQNGLGITHGTIGGIVSAEMASATSADSLVSDYQPQALPSRLLPEPFMTLGARATLKFKEWQAGVEL